MRYYRLWIKKVKPATQVGGLFLQRYKGDELTVLVLSTIQLIRTQRISEEM